MHASGAGGMACLEVIHWRMNNLHRLCCLANEMHQMQRLPEDSNPALEILRAATCHIGDTTIVENSHQQAKDGLRDARHNQKSKIASLALISIFILKESWLLVVFS